MTPFSITRAAPITPSSSAITSGSGENFNAIQLRAVYGTLDTIKIQAGALGCSDAGTKAQADAIAALAEVAKKQLAALKTQPNLRQTHSTPTAGPTTRSTSSTPKQRFNLVLSLFKQGKYAEAEPHFKALLEDPATPPDLKRYARFNLGYSLFKQGKFAEAESHLRAVVDDPEIPPDLKRDARFNLGVSLCHQGKYAEAEPHFKALLEDPATTENDKRAIREQINKIRSEDRQAESARAATPFADVVVVSVLAPSSATGGDGEENTAVDVLVGLGSGAKRKAGDDTSRKSVKRRSARLNSPEKSGLAVLI